MTTVDGGGEGTRSGAATTAELVRALNDILQRLLDHPDPEVGRLVEELLAGYDAIHREGLTRLAEGIQAMAGEAFLNRLCQDPGIELLFMSYGLVAVSRRVQADEALDAVRPALQADGVSLEVTDVVGGVVYVDVRSKGGRAPAEVEAELEAALRDGLLGFQEVQIGGRAWTPMDGALVQIQAPEGGRPASYQRVARLDDVRGTTPTTVSVEGGHEPVLLLETEGDIQAFVNRCGDTPLPLHFSRLEGDTLVCSWHGCRYDAASGQRLDDPEAPGLTRLPTRVREDHVEVAVDHRGSR